MHKPLKTLVSAAVLGVMAANFAHAGAFSLYTESSALMTGNFGAGAAAEGADASIGWYNPAGLVLLHEQQVVFGGVGVFPTAKISGTSTFSTSSPDSSYIQSFSDLSGAENALVPSFHYALPLGENMTFGLSFVAPFGLSTDWGNDSAVRYQATRTELLTMNLAPELGGRLTQNFSVGGGLDLQYARVTFNRVLGAPSLLDMALLPPTGLDTLSTNKGDSYGVGFHAGVMGMFNDNHTRLGLNYQSKMRHTFHGYSELSGILANSGFNFAQTTLPFPTVRVNNNLSSSLIELPDIVTLSAFHDVNEKISVLGSIVYTGWSTFKTIQLNNVAAPSISDGSFTPLGDVSQVTLNNASAQNYRDTWRAALGVNYHFNQQLMLRVGGGYDQTPTNNTDRDVRLPDASRWALSMGAHYQVKPTIGVDVGYTHLFPADKPSINRTDALGLTAAYNVTATGVAGADLLGAQVVWLMDKPLEVSGK